MKAAIAQESCACGLDVREDIWLCPHHRYFKGKQEFVSVTKVIKTVLPTDYANIDPVTLEIARLRGVFVDNYFSEYLRNPSEVVAPEYVKDMIEPEFPRDNEKHALDTAARINRLLDWWHKSLMKLQAVQGVVYNEAHRVAGTFDLATEDGIWDIKCVSELQPNYRLQLGAYLSYDPLGRDKTGIIHVTKDKVRLIPYFAFQCQQQWNAAIDWYWTRHALTS